MPNTEKVREMFDSIAGDYDRLNHLLSLDIDKTWRRRSLRYFLTPECPQTILDLACGTGDYSIDIARHAHPQTVVRGLDLSEGMLKIMDEKVRMAGLEERVVASQGNCEKMDFPDGCFDCVTIGFGIRNFEHREVALREIFRVLKPGGKLVILELSLPSNRLVRAAYNFYFTRFLPLIGGKISGDKRAYKYLPASVIAFPPKEKWMKTMGECSFRNVRHRAYSFGICRLYVGES